MTCQWEQPLLISDVGGSLGALAIWVPMCYGRFVLWQVGIQTTNRTAAQEPILLAYFICGWSMGKQLDPIISHECNLWAMPDLDRRFNCAEISKEMSNYIQGPSHANMD